MKLDLFDLRRRENILKTFAYLAVAAFALVIIFTLIFSKSSIDGFYFSGKLFSDFAENLEYSICKNPYTGDYGVISIYPPIAFIFFAPFAWICRGPIEGLMDGTVLLENISSYGSFVFSFILYYLITMALIMFLVAKITKFKGKELVYMMIITFLFGPFLYAFGRGNIIITSLVFMLIFFWLYKSDKRILRELSIVSLGLAASIKIYPIFFCFLLLNDKRYVDFVKGILYTIGFIILPFGLIEGGFSNLSVILGNFSKFSSGEGRSLDWTNISVAGNVSKLCAFLSSIFGGTFSGLESILSKLLTYGMVLLMILFSVLSKNRLRLFVLVIASYELFQGVSYNYTIIFMLIALMIFFLDYNEKDLKNNFFYLVCFLLLASPIVYFVKFSSIQSLVLMVMLVKIYIDEFKSLKRKDKSVSVETVV